MGGHRNKYHDHHRFWIMNTIISTTMYLHLPKSQFKFYLWTFYQTQVRLLTCLVSKSLHVLNFAQILWFVKVVILKFLLVATFTYQSLCYFVVCQNWFLDFSKLLHEFVKIDKEISLSCYVDFSKWLHGIFKVVTWICQFFLCISRPLPNKTKMKFGQGFKLVEASALS